MRSSAYIDIDIVEFLLRAYRQWRMVKSAGLKSARLKRSLQQNGVSYAVEISDSAGLKSALLKRSLQQNGVSYAVEISDAPRIWWRIM